MKKGDKITMYFDCFGTTSEELVKIKNIEGDIITIKDYFNTNDGVENYKFSLKSGKCLNEPNFGFGGKRRIS